MRLCPGTSSAPHLLGLLRCHRLRVPVLVRLQSRQAAQAAVVAVVVPQLQVQVQPGSA